MRLLVFGGRDYMSYNLMSSALHELTGGFNRDDVLLLGGGAKGADYLGKVWAYDNDYMYNEFLADWANLGRAAGPIRNQRMIDEGRPTLALRCGGRDGSQDMHRRLERAGVAVRDVYDWDYG